MIQTHLMLEEQQICRNSRYSTLRCAQIDGKFCSPQVVDDRETSEGFFDTIEELDRSLAIFTVNGFPWPSAPKKNEMSNGI